MNNITLEIMRYNPEKDHAPYYQSYVIEWTHDMSVLDALQLIKDTQDPSLSFRWSCRMEVCGSCGMVINGEPKLACSTFIRDYATAGCVRVGALDQFPIEKDLVVDVKPFIDRFESVKPYIIRREAPPTQGEYLQTPQQLAQFKAYTMCINCMLCYQACPQFALNADFLGPAASAMALRYNLDNRDQGAEERFDILNHENGIWPCTFVGYCSEVCPKSVDPAGALQQAKVGGLFYWARAWLAQANTSTTAPTGQDAASSDSDSKQGE